MYKRSKETDNQIKLFLPASVIGQINCIVHHYSTEVSWYGDIEYNKDLTEFRIVRVYLFPQVVTGGTFRTDTPQISEEYDAWYDKMLNEAMDRAGNDPEKFKPIMQYNGHSHVSAPVGASGEDTRFRESRTGVNVYSIHNKAGASNWEIWLDDVVYEDQDIKIVYEDDVFKDKDFVKTPVSTYGSAYGVGYGVGYGTSKITPYNQGVASSSYWDRTGIEEDTDAYGVSDYVPKRHRYKKTAKK
jgi:hypothetical protein